MKMPGTDGWRVALVLSGVLIAVGGPRHPRGAMVQMLADPAWVPAHALMCAGFAALLVALVLFRRRALPPRTAWWSRLAVAAAALQTIEMGLHAAAVVDHAHLAAGQPTPVLTTHLAIAVPIYPLFAVAMIGLMVAGARDRSLGSAWIAPVGILGAIGHGLSAPRAILAGVWPARVALREGAPRLADA
jgi:hypothetical protein